MCAKATTRSHSRPRICSIWGRVHSDTPFYFPNREALIDLFRDVVSTPGVEHYLLSHCTMAPVVVGIRNLSSRYRKSCLTSALSNCRPSAHIVKGAFCHR